MKVPVEQQLQLLELQRVETEQARVARRRRSSPLSQRVAELAASVEALNGELVALRTDAGDLDRAIRRAEQDLDNVRERRRRDEDLIGSGVGAKVQSELAHELASLRRRQGELEDAELELLEQQEQITARQAQADTDLAAAQDQLREARAALAEEHRELDGRAAALAAERDGLLGGLDAALLDTYRRSRNHLGIAAARFADGQCQGCRLSIPSAEAAELLARPVDELQHCEECGCILVRA